MKHLWKCIKQWRFNRTVRRSVRVLDALDWEMKRLHWTRHQRKAFWREYTKNHRFRSDVLNNLTPK